MKARSIIQLAATLVVLHLGTIASDAQMVTASVSAGTAPLAMAVNPVTNKIYVVNSESNTVTVIDGATNSTATVSTGSQPHAVAVNPVTNKIYVANLDSADVTVIDGVTNATTTIITGVHPEAVAVNPVTNQIYVANTGSNNVTVINGATNSTSTVTVRTRPYAVAVNPVSNKIYVANFGSNSVTVIDGATNNATTVGAGSGPFAITVNPVTNMVYVANFNSANVTVINGANNSTTSISTGTYPASVAVNAVTNQIYVANFGGNNVTVIDGATNGTATVGTGASPEGLAVNPVTNQIYVANTGSNNVTVINGSTNGTTTVNGISSPASLVVNPVTNKIYVNSAGNDVTVIDGATDSTTTVSTGSNPYAVAVNPVTNKIYVANEGNADVTVIDGATGNTTTVNTGTRPYAVAVNPVTNQIYVANQGSNDVTVIDGATNNTTTIATGRSPQSVAVNPVTNKIYVTNYGDGTVSAIDGATGNTTTVVAGSEAWGVAVNPVTNKIYVANRRSTSITVIDGATNTSTNVNIGTVSSNVAVNPVTNQVYFNDVSSPHNTVTVLNGLTNGTSTVSTGNSPWGVAVNPLTNKIYVANETSGSVTVIDGATNTTTTVTAGATPYAIAVNPATNKIYVANQADNTVTVIDGATNSTTTLSAGTTPYALAVNPVTNQIYVANEGSSNVTAITEQQVQTIPITTAITPLAGNIAESLTPSFSFTASNSLTGTPVDNLLYQVDSWQGPWTAATNQGSGAFSATMGTLEPGFHVLYAYASDGEEATSTTSTNSGLGNSPLIGSIAAYGFVVAPPIAAASPASLSFSSPGVGVATSSQTVTLNNPGGAPLTFSIGFTGTNYGDFSETADTCSTADGQLAGSSSCTINVLFNPSTGTAEYANLTITDNSGGFPGNSQTVALTGTTAALTPIANSQTTTTTEGGQVAVTLTGSDPQGQALTFVIDSPPANGSVSAVTPIGATSASVVYTPNLVFDGSDSFTFHVVDTSGYGSTEATVTVNVSPYSATTAMALATNFGSVQVTGASSQLVTFTFTSAGVIGAPTVVTQGATGLDFTDVGDGTCNAQVTTHVFNVGNTCTVDVNFKPTAPGQRNGAVELLDNVGYLLAIGYVQGTGVGPQVNFPPGTQSTLGSGFVRPTGVAVDASGNIFVSFGGLGVVKEMVAAGGYSTIKAVGSGFTSPNGVAVDGAGNVFVADAGANAVKEILAAGGYTTVNILGSGFNEPSGVAVDGSGNIYVADTQNNAVKQIVAAGGYTTVNTLGSGFNQPNGVAVDGNGNVYVGDWGNGAVKEILAAGGYTTVNTLGSGFVDPAGVAVDVNGNVFVADTNSNGVGSPGNAVREILAVGGYTTVITVGSGFDNPYGVAVDGLGNVYFVNPGSPNTGVDKLDFADAPSLTFPTATVAPGVDSTDGLMVVSVENYGNAPLTAVAPGLTPPADFTQVAGSGTPPDCTASFSLAAGATCNLSIEFAPTTTGTLNESFVLTDNALNASNAVQSISVSGTGLAAVATTTALASSPDPSSYGMSVTILATVTPASGTTAATGTVQFSVDGITAGSAVTLSGGSAAYVTSTLTTATHSITAVYSPASGSPFTASASVPLSQVVTQAVPTVTFTGAPASAPYESSFTVAASTNASTPAVITASGPCSIAGTTVTVTASSGTCTLTASWAADNNYLAATATQTSVATQATPTINWATPAAITYGATLTATQLNATAAYNGTAVTGTFTYNPAKGTVLPAGTQTLTVSFTPKNTTDYTSANASVTLQVNQATPKITWAKPAAITYGTSLDDTQLDATTSVLGTFAYSPAAGTVLTAGAQILSVTFTPIDTTDYTTATATVPITVSKAAMTLTWATPAPITYGTPLSSTQLDATATVPGSFVYTPAAGAIVTGGSKTLSVTFTPTDNVDYSTATATVTLQVGMATPTINWSTPAAITYGTALTGTQLNATATYNGASVGGTFTYTPAKGSVLTAGSQTLSVTFTPNNTTNYAVPPGASVTLQVNQATPKITWAKPSAITYGTALSGTQLDATASVPGTFLYSPIVGTILNAGAQSLEVGFTPSDTIDYTSATDTVALTVNEAASTTVINSSSPNPSSVGQAVTVNFTVSGATGTPTGSVTVTASTGETCTGALTSGTGSCQLTFTATGSHKLTAVYASDGNFKSSTSAKVTQVVQ